jgi:hypothetical protein
MACLVICMEGLRKTEANQCPSWDSKQAPPEYKCLEYYHISLLQKLLMYYAGSEVLTVVVMKSYFFWDIMLCSPLKVSQRFRWTYYLHLQGQRISQARNQPLCLLPALCWFHASLTLRPWRWRQHFPPKRQMTYKYRNIMFLDIIHHYVFIQKHRPFYFSKRFGDDSVSVFR